MSQLPQKYQTSKALPASAFSPQKMTIARQLNQDMAVVQSNEILAQEYLEQGCRTFGAGKSDFSSQSASPRTSGFYY